MIPIVEMINRYIEGYLNYLSLEYDLVLSRMQLHHRILNIMNDVSPKLTEIYIYNRWDHLKHFYRSRVSVYSSSTIPILFIVPLAKEGVHIFLRNGSYTNMHT